MTRGIYAYIDKQDNNIIYVGLDSNINKSKRHRAHLAPSEYNRQSINRVLQNNPDRYIYQVLWEIDDCTDNHLNQMEVFYIKKYDPKFNFTEGGGGMSGFKHSEKTRKKISEAHKGKTPSEETRKKLSENNARYWQGKTLSEEHKRKISEAQKGKTLSEETRKKVSENNARYWQGKTLSEETRKKISEAQNITGFYRVSKKKENNCKQNFLWRYLYYINDKQKQITSVNILKLKNKVEAQNLPWEIIDEGKAKKSLELNNKYHKGDIND